MGCTCQSGSKPYDFFLLHLIVGSLLLVLFLNPCGRTLCSVLLLAQSVTIHLSLFLPAEGSQPLRWVNFRTFRFQFCSLSVHIKQPACASFLPGSFWHESDDWLLGSGMLHAPLWVARSRAERVQLSAIPVFSAAEKDVIITLISWWWPVHFLFDTAVVIFNK